MAIDDPKAAFEQQYMTEENPSPLALLVLGGKLAFPKAGLPLEIFNKVVQRLSGPSIDERVRETWKMFVMETEHLEHTKASQDDVAEAIQIALRRDAEQFNDVKRERYVKLIGNALRSDEQVQDVASFIRTVEQLTDRDVSVLKVLNKVMNRQGDWRVQHNPGVGDIMKVHPNVFTQRSQELSVQIALALGQPVEKNAYSREEGFGICNRLQGFGLAHGIEQTRELPQANYCFRLSVYGVRLLRLLGEDVPNYGYYFKDHV